MLLTVAIVLLSGGSAAAADSPPTAVESDIEAIYLYNFIRFTEWPEDDSAEKNEGIKLVIMGNLSLLKVFRSDVFRKASADFKLQTIACDTLQCAPRGSALFIDRSMGSELPKILHSLQNKAVLTVSDIPGFADQGGMIELARQQGRVTFRINLKAVRRAGLYISAQLLQLSEIVEEQP